MTVLIKVKAEIEDDDISLSEVENKVYDAMEDIVDYIETVTVKEVE